MQVYNFVKQLQVSQYGTSMFFIRIFRTTDFWGEQKQTLQKVGNCNHTVQFTNCHRHMEFWWICFWGVQCYVKQWDWLTWQTTEYWFWWCTLCFIWRCWAVMKPCAIKSAMSDPTLNAAESVLWDSCSCFEVSFYMYWCRGVSGSWKNRPQMRDAFESLP